MRVAFGNAAPTRIDRETQGTAPRVTYIEVPDSYTYEVADSAADLARETMEHIATAPDGITHMPGQEALIAVVTAFRAESTKPPSWVWSDNADFAVLLGRYFDCPVGVPEDVEETHHTLSGPPGTGPLYVHPDDDPIPPVLEGADAQKVEPPADAGDTEASA